MRTLLDGIDDFASHWNLELRVFTEAHANGVANALGEQSANAYSTLDATVFTLASLSHTEMQRIVHVFAIHRLNKQAHALHHDHRVRGLDRDNHIVELLALEDA